jgi:hypothetical protein
VFFASVSVRRFRKKIKKIAMFNIHLGKDRLWEAIRVSIQFGIEMAFQSLVSDSFFYSSFGP